MLTTLLAKGAVTPSSQWGFVFKGYMQHHFSAEIAKKYDIITAILLDNFYYWTVKNKANEKHFYNGLYWTYNSKKAMCEWFPYLNERQIDYALKKMVANNLIVSGNFNENKYDRTLWYAITNFGLSILQNCEMYNNIYITNTNTNTIKENNTKESQEQSPLNSQNEQVATTEDLEVWFSKTYEIYPRKVGKVQAKTTFAKKLKGLSREEAKKKAVGIYKMLQRQIELWKKENDWQGRKLEHIPYFSSWLNANIEDNKNNIKGVGL